MGSSGSKAYQTSVVMTTYTGKCPYGFTQYDYSSGGKLFSTASEVHACYEPTTWPSTAALVTFTDVPSTTHALALYSKGDCYSAITSRSIKTNFAQGKVCKAGAAEDGTCWLPYWYNSATNSCVPHDSLNTGQFSASTKSVQKTASSYGIPAGVSTASFGAPPASGVVASKTNTVAVGAVSGGSVGAAAVIGLAIFNRRRALKKPSKPEDKLELSAAQRV